MTLTDLLVESNDIRGRARRVSDTYECYTKSLEKYIPWMKEQINKSKEGFIRIKRGDLARAMKKDLEIVMGDRYRNINFKSLYKIIIAVLFNEGIFTELDIYDREKVFVMRNRTPDDCLIPGLAKLEKNMKGTNN
jgi:hypothetical protein